MKTMGIDISKFDGNHRIYWPPSDFNRALRLKEIEKRGDWLDQLILKAPGYWNDTHLWEFTGFGPCLSNRDLILHEIGIDRNLAIYEIGSSQPHFGFLYFVYNKRIDKPYPYRSVYLNPENGMTWQIRYFRWEVYKFLSGDLGLRRLGSYVDGEDVPHWAS